MVLAITIIIIKMNIKNIDDEESDCIEDENENPL